MAFKLSEFKGHLGLKNFYHSPHNTRKLSKFFRKSTPIFLIAAFMGVSFFSYAVVADQCHIQPYKSIKSSIVRAKFFYDQKSKMVLKDENMHLANHRTTRNMILNLKIFLPEVLSKHFERTAVLMSQTSSQQTVSLLISQTVEIINRSIKKNHQLFKDEELKGSTRKIYQAFTVQQLAYLKFISNKNPALVEVQTPQLFFMALAQFVMKIDFQLVASSLLKLITADAHNHLKIVNALPYCQTYVRGLITPARQNQALPVFLGLVEHQIGLRQAIESHLLSNMLSYKGESLCLQIQNRLSAEALRYNQQEKRRILKLKQQGRLGQCLNASTLL